MPWGSPKVSRASPDFVIKPPPQMAAPSGVQSESVRKLPVGRPSQAVWAKGRPGKAAPRTRNLACAELSDSLSHAKIPLFSSSRLTAGLAIATIPGVRRGRLPKRVTSMEPADQREALVRLAILARRQEGSMNNLRGLVFAVPGVSPALVSLPAQSATLRSPLSALAARS